MPFKRRSVVGYTIIFVTGLMMGRLLAIFSPPTKPGSSFSVRAIDYLESNHLVDVNDLQAHTVSVTLYLKDRLCVQFQPKSRIYGPLWTVCFFKDSDQVEHFKISHEEA
jgi:hypothetical protein